MECRRHASPCEKAGGEPWNERPGSERKPEKKHSCPDCHFCQLCSDSRCHACRSEKSGGGCFRKMSFSEQICLYDEVNLNDPFIGKKSK